MNSTTQIVGLSKTGAAWIEASSAQSTVWREQEWLTQESATTIATHLQSIRQSFGKSNVVWSIGPDLVQHWIQKFPVGVASLAELLAVAQARAVSLFPGAENQTPWAISADWAYGEDVLCTALPGAWQTALLPMVESGISQIQTPLDWALGLKSSQIPHSGWIAVSTPNELYVVYRLNGRCVTLRKVRLPIDTQPELLQSLVSAEWKRELVKLADTPEKLTWFNLADEVNQAPSSSIKLVQLRPARSGTQGPTMRLQSTDSDARKMAWVGTAMRQGVLA